MLGLVFVVLAVVLAPTLRTYLAQREQIAALRLQVKQQQRSVSDLEAQRKAWDDPAYVEQQARDRLKFVRPGEKSYTVLDTRKKADTSTSPVKAAAATASKGDRAWFGDLWRSVEIAGAGR